jgi:glucose/arabinose dehydrogenase
MWRKAYPLRPSGRPWRVLLVAALLLMVLPQTTRAATLPAGFTETLVASGLAAPTTMAIAPDGRLFVAEQGGTLRVIKNGVLLTQPFLTVETDASGERGLLGIAFDPNFASTRHVYVYYTATTPTLHNRVSRFTANGDVAQAGSERVIVDLDPLNSPTARIHNGGAMHFGPDGKLYIAVGENGIPQYAQTLANRFGKLLRLNADGSIPTDNPFYSQATGANRAIWALGLRNPYRFAFQPGTGRLYINDVGRDTWEEINEGAAGANYGWPTTEGPTTDPRFRAPIFAYRHGDGTDRGCAITGGVFYNPATGGFPADPYRGDYFFTDYCNGWLRHYDPATGAVAVFATGLSWPVDLAVSPTGVLYYLARGTGPTTGVVYQIQYSTGQAPAIPPAGQPAPVTVAAGQPATFRVSATGSPPLAYQWQRDNQPIGGATGPGYTLPAATVADSGASFRVVVSNAHGDVTSAAARLTVVPANPPTAVISAPAEGARYTAGQTLSFTGSATDPEQGALPPSALTWTVDFHHDDHTHPLYPATSGKSGDSVVLPNRGHPETNVWYRITLTARDATGLEHTTTRDVRPNLGSLTLASQPAGAPLTLDGQPVTAPSTTPSVVGTIRAVSAPTSWTLNGVRHVFERWSDGGAATHDITTPATPATYTAVYRADTGGQGTGLTATYYNNNNFTGTTVTRLDPMIDFAWGNGAPAPGIAADTFSVRWEGRVRADHSETYTFTTRADDGVRLWVDGQLLINNWPARWPLERSASIALVGGREYDIVMEYYENYATARASLLWSSPSTPRAVVPTSHLFPR